MGSHFNAHMSVMFYCAIVNVTISNVKILSQNSVLYGDPILKHQLLEEENGTKPCESKEEWLTHGIYI